MSERFDVMVPRKSRDGSKTYWTKIGVMFPMKNGGYSITFEALPIPTLSDDGSLECRALAMVPQERDGQGGGRGPQPRRETAGTPDLDDEIPF
jgi:hypothetical protein